jgi:type IV pilus assembly protein PilB
MGVAAFNIAAAVNLITAQRLARRLCSCKQPIDVPLDMLLNAGFHESQLDGSPLYRAVGCELCSGSGYKGRLGVYQVMPITEAIESIILAHGTALEIEAQARREGVRTLREAGLLKVKQGYTTLEEIISCTNH